MKPFISISEAQSSSDPKALPAQETQIKWLSQWPLPENAAKKKKHAGFKTLIFGIKNPVLVRPVNLIASDADHMWVLDQETKSILEMNHGSMVFPHFIQKQKNDLLSLVGICNYSGNDLLVTDSYSNKIYVIDPSKKKCTVLNDSLKLEKPTGIAWSSDNKEIWVTETGKHRIVVLNEEGKLIRTIGKRGNAEGEFNFPTHLCIDKQGFVYVVDAMNFRIQVLNGEGKVISMFGSNGDATGYFASPKGITTDSHGNIYIVDALFHAVQIFDIRGNFLYTFGTQGQGEGEFWMPSGIYIDNNDKIYVADCYNSRIQIFQLVITAKK